MGRVDSRAESCPASRESGRVIPVRVWSLVGWCSDERFGAVPNRPTPALTLIAPVGDTVIVTMGSDRRASAQRGSFASRRRTLPLRVP